MSDRSHALDVEIRAAALDEVPLIQQVAIDADTRYAATGHAALADGSTIPTAVAVRAIESNSLAVACVDDRVVGWVYTARIDGEPCIGHICVASAFGRRGIGSSLLEHVIAVSRARGDASIVLNTQTDVAWGRAWYERFGFVVVPRESWSAAFAAIADAQTADGLDWSTRVHMRLRLEARPGG